MGDIVMKQAEDYTTRNQLFSSLKGGLHASHSEVHWLCMLARDVVTVPSKTLK
jgi:hypothetical protein